MSDTLLENSKYGAAVGAQTDQSVKQEGAAVGQGLASASQAFLGNFWQARQMAMQEMQAELGNQWKARELELAEARYQEGIRQFNVNYDHNSKLLDLQERKMRLSMMQQQAEMAMRQETGQVRRRELELRQMRAEVEGKIPPVIGEGNELYYPAKAGRTMEKVPEKDLKAAKAALADWKKRIRQQKDALTRQALSRAAYNEQRALDDVSAGTKAAIQDMERSRKDSITVSFPGAAPIPADRAWDLMINGSFGKFDSGTRAAAMLYLADLIKKQPGMSLDLGKKHVLEKLIERTTR